MRDSIHAAGQAFHVQIPGVNIRSDKLNVLKPRQSTGDFEIARHRTHLETFSEQRTDQMPTNETGGPSH
ncbi:hypothetical protein D3C72_2221930 [compost metagenome]